MNKIPKQLTKLLSNSDVKIHRKLPDDVLEKYGQVFIMPGITVATDIYVVYHSGTLNRLVWPSIPVEIDKEYETKGSSMRLIDYLNFDIPNKDDKLSMIVQIVRTYDFDKLLHTSTAQVYIPRKKKTFRRITRDYFVREEKSMTGEFGIYYSPEFDRTIA